MTERTFSRRWPFGYDSQAYLYNTVTHDFLEKEKGLYAVASHEIFLPDFELHAGMNINEFDNTKLYGFFGATYKIVPSFALLAEYDNIRNAADNRVNLGGAIWVTSYFNVDVAARMWAAVKDAEENASSA